MRRILIFAAIAASLALGACSKSEQDKTKTDLDAAAKKVVAGTDQAADKLAAGTRDLANDPKLKAVGSEVKAVASDAGRP